jgi:WD40 repeat protein
LYFANCPSGGDVGGRLAWSPNSKLLATINLNQTYICDPFSDVVLGSFEGRMSNQELNFGYQNALSWRPDGLLLAGAAGDGLVRIWDVSSFISSDIQH